VAVAASAGGVRRRVTHFDVVEKAAAGPSATGTCAARGQQAIAGDHARAPPCHAPEQPRSPCYAKVTLILSKPGKDHSNYFLRYRQAIHSPEFVTPAPDTEGQRFLAAFF